MKLCKDCSYYLPDEFPVYAKCAHPLNATRSLVDGSTIYQTCNNARNWGKCGPNANFFNSLCPLTMGRPVQDFSLDEFQRECEIEARAQQRETDSLERAERIDSDPEAQQGAKP